MKTELNTLTINEMIKTAYAESLATHPPFASNPFAAQSIVFALGAALESTKTLEVDIEMFCENIGDCFVYPHLMDTKELEALDLITTQCTAAVFSYLDVLLNIYRYRQSFDLKKEKPIL